MRNFGMLVLEVVIFTLVCGMVSYAAQGTINVNTATMEELQWLPGVGEKIAQNIVDFRQANGPFASLDDLLKIVGIGERRLAEIKPFLSLEGETTYKPAEKTAAQGKKSGGAKQ
ncbi:MAG: helix-hairpin-helix domain-containing protein [Desulfomonilia bacterium]|nr:helix-hairpin-helix domain-containing protein [Desulfomonilia bacterium]